MTFHPDTWPKASTTVDHWFPCQCCGSWFMRVGTAPFVELLASLWSATLDQCPDCCGIDIADNKHPSLRNYLQRFKKD